MLEKKALHKSLKRFFPKERHGQEVRWETPRWLNGATSNRLRPLKNNNVKISKPMKKLAQAMFDEVFITKADLVIVIDDVELHNLDQESIIAEHFRKAIELVINKKGNDQSKCYRNILREKCSFHLLKPMMESYFFGDIAALQKTGISASITPKLVHETDVELFETNDPDPEWLKQCRDENMKNSRNNLNWKYEKHPKNYLEHLIERSHPGMIYHETDQGKNALESIAWNKVPKCKSDTPFIRSLFEDIADWFEIQNPMGYGDINKCVYPEKSVNSNDLILRNLLIKV